MCIYTSWCDLMTCQRRSLSLTDRVISVWLSRWTACVFLSAYILSTYSSRCKHMCVSSSSSPRSLIRPQDREYCHSRRWNGQHAFLSLSPLSAKFIIIIIMSPLFLGLAAFSWVIAGVGGDLVFFFSVFRMMEWYLLEVGRRKWFIVMIYNIFLF